MGSKRRKAPRNPPATRKEEKVAAGEPAALSGNGSSLPDNSPLPPRAITAGERAAWAGFLIILALCFVWIFGHAWMVDSITVRLCQQADIGIANPADRPPVFLAPPAFDGYVWNRHAEYLGRDGRLRLRVTDFDNAPYGREVHWNSLFAWYLRGLGEARGLWVDDSLRNNIARMSIWANPILLALAVSLIGALAARRYGPLSGSAIIIGMVTTPSFYEGFMPGYPDHHGIISLALLGLTFGLAWAGGGWVQARRGNGFAPPHSLTSAKIGILISALSGAAGLWFSALSTALVLAVVGVGVLIANMLFARKATASGCTFHPELLRLWAVVGASASFALYLAEYFPWYLSLRLEVNHPLYSLAWLGGGWMLAELCAWFAAPAKKRTPFPWQRFLLPAAACLVLPAAILLGGERTYIPSDPFMGRLFKNIAELLPLLLRIELQTLTWEAALGFYPLLLLAGAVMLFLKKLDGGSKLCIVLLSTPILLITGLQFYQTRWGMLAGPLYIALAGLVAPLLWRQVRGRGLATPVAGAALAGYALLVGYPAFSGWIQPVIRQCFAGKEVSMDAQQALHLLHRDMAKAIRNNAAGRPVTLLSSPNSSCILSAMGDFRTIGTLYWENVDGLKAAAAILNAQSDEEALEKLKARGVTHVSLMTWENFIGPYFQILYPEPVGGKSLENSFAQAALFGNRLPVWARPIPFANHPLAVGLQQRVLLLEIVPDQSREEALLHVVRYLRLTGEDPAAAEKFAREGVQARPEDLEVRAELVDVILSRGRPIEASKEILALLPKASPEQRHQLLSRFVPQLSQAGAVPEALGLLRTISSQEDALPASIADSAWVFATLPDPALRDGIYALEMVERLPQDNAPQFQLLRAAALAASGHFALAIALVEPLANDPQLGERASAMLEAYRRGDIWSDAH